MKRYKVVYGDWSTFVEADNLVASIGAAFRRFIDEQDPSDEEIGNIVEPGWEGEIEVRPS
jgi:hypothetical protein